MKLLKSIFIASMLLNVMTLPAKADSIYKIINANYGKCLNLQSGENKSPGMASVYRCVDHPDQEWYLQKL